jgi:uncharacterized protein (TIGR02145 family)/uncharacterized repeat protein (TIGR02543 family)
MKKKTVLKTVGIAAVAALFCIGCGDKGVTPPTEYTLNIDVKPLKGGSVDCKPSKTSYKFGDTVTITATADVGYRFVRWTGVSTSTDSAITIIINTNLKLTANFEQMATHPVNAYTITFDPNGGIVNPTSATTDTTSWKLASLPEPARNGYTFNGWYTAAEGGTEVTVNNVYPANTTIYARWTANPSGNTFTDSRDGKTYKKVVIGTQTWMAENLNYDVPSNTTDVCYNNKADSCEKYGRLYNWLTAMTACPAGWHLPLDAEWATLENYVGSPVGTKLKSTSGWYNNGNGTDQYDFSALPGGYGYSDGGFLNAGGLGLWWSATENDALYACGQHIHYNGDEGRGDRKEKTNLFSVRCVQD